MHLPTKIKIDINELDVYSQKQKQYDIEIHSKIIYIRRNFFNNDTKFRKYDLILIVDKLKLDDILGDSTVDFSIDYLSVKYEVLTIDSLIDYSNEIRYYEIKCVEYKN